MPQTRSQELQLRASLTNDGDRQALLANPDAINIPLEQLAAGRVFVSELNSVARKQGSMALRVTGNPHAEDFYLACGFKQIGTTQTRFGVGLLLRREL
jgi:hypothetical protein